MLSLVLISITIECLLWARYLLSTVLIASHLILPATLKCQLLRQILFTVHLPKVGNWVPKKVLLQIQVWVRPKSKNLFLTPFASGLRKYPECLWRVLFLLPHTVSLNPTYRKEDLEYSGSLIQFEMSYLSAERNHLSWSPQATNLAAILATESSFIYKDKKTLSASWPSHYLLFLRPHTVSLNSERIVA